MPVRFTRVFGLYTFFSVFLPGLTFLLGIAPLASVLLSGKSTAALIGDEGGRQLVTVLGLLVFVTLSMFVGFGLHTLGAWIEDKVGDFRMWPTFVDSICPWGFCLGGVTEKFTIRIGKRHRTLFFETVNGHNDNVGPRLVSAFVDVADETFPFLELDLGKRVVEEDATSEGPTQIRKHLLKQMANGGHGLPPDGSWTVETNGTDGGGPNRISASQADSLYTLVRSNIHMAQTGRSRTFQAVFSACRSTFVAWALLTFLYTAYVTAAFLVASGGPRQLFVWETRDLFKHTLDISVPFVSEPNVFTAFSFTVIVGFFGMYGFAAVARNSKRYYLKYLISDFLLLQSEYVDQNLDDTSRTQF